MRCHCSADLYAYDSSPLTSLLLIMEGDCHSSSALGPKKTQRQSIIFWEEKDVVIQLDFISLGQIIKCGNRDCTGIP